jgi:predicted aconitase
MFNTCTPYQVGNVPTRGEHCAWMESSAVAYCNAVLGARTNTEGRESAGAASITGRIPDWGLHRAENRLGTHLIDVRVNVDSVMDWGLLGYYVGEVVEDGIPVLEGIRHSVHMAKLKHFGAAASSSGGVEMYHIPGFTPEADTTAEAFGGGPASARLSYGPEERRQAYEWLNSSASDTSVDFIMLGCPHASVGEIWQAARRLEGKRVHENVDLWVFAPRALTDTAELSGHAEIIRKAGGHLLSDTCPAVGRVLPKDTKVVATDSAKQAHYLPAIMNVETWFGSVDDCIDAALTGRWRGQIF